MTERFVLQQRCDERSEDFNFKMYLEMLLPRTNIQVYISGVLCRRHCVEP